MNIQQVEELKSKGYNYSEQIIDGQILGVWNKQQAIRDVYEKTFGNHKLLKKELNILDDFWKFIEIFRYDNYKLSWLKVHGGIEKH